MNTEHFTAPKTGRFRCLTPCNDSKRPVRDDTYPKDERETGNAPEFPRERLSPGQFLEQYLEQPFGGLFQEPPQARKHWDPFCVGNTFSSTPLRIFLCFCRQPRCIS
jgi:hypothetical protein